ncbi:hypothetical protein TRAPUB_14056 [Trametes pubescens]|uniref:Uncharacterized protein n=1 Tax=Trametes pubescens TaxID=154538 RepID=A0A1M2VPJ4_TRAPU|nr:hypothetical protein TRAPUB_14056 [Trametes pubescens]
MSNTESAKDLHFPTPFAPVLRYPTLLLEHRIRRFAREIKEKPCWWEKVHNPDIVARWTQEIVDRDGQSVKEHWGGERLYEAFLPDPNNENRELEKMWPRDPITDAQLRYLFDELKYHADQRDTNTGIYPAFAQQTAIPMVYESPALIDSALKAAIKQVAATLENVADDQKDWHPGSNGQVLDLVHPSLYCLRIGQSFALDPRPGHSDPLRPLSVDDYFRSRLDMSEFCPEDAWGANQIGRVPYDFTVSRAYQWLPTDFAVSEDGRVAPKGYINNLNPCEHSAAYETISSVLECFLPLIERVLSDVLSPAPPSPFVGVDPGGWYNHLPQPYNWWEDTPEAEEWDRVHLWPRLPDAEPFKAQPPEERIKFDLRGRTIQVIVKMANIVLSPESPSYPGGSWHVEGMSNEKIVATGLYYFDSANITESRLAFRAAVGDGEYPGASLLPGQQDDSKGYAVAYGLGRGEALNQELESIVAVEDKCVAFPNVYQHRVAPFALADRTRPGHRKILAFFVVDPSTHIHSTSDVPPQQAEWYRDAVYGAERFRRLPQELVDMILEYVLESTVSLEQAKADREALTEERVQFVVSHNEKVFEDTFNMCEH